MTHRYRRYADRVGIKSSLKETRSFSATQLLTSGVDLNTVAGRLGHAKGSTTLQYYAQFTRPADQRAAGVIPAQLDQLRKKETLRGLFQKLPAAVDDLAALAADLGPRAGLDAETALPWLASFTADATANLRGPGTPEASTPTAAESRPLEIASPPSAPRKPAVDRSAPRKCPECGALLETAKAGRLPVYCGQSCKQRAYQRRKREAAARVT